MNIVLNVTRGYIWGIKEIPPFIWELISATFLFVVGLFLVLPLDVASPSFYTLIHSMGMEFIGVIYMAVSLYVIYSATYFKLRMRKIGSILSLILWCLPCIVLLECNCVTATLPFYFTFSAFSTYYSLRIMSYRDIV